MSENRHTEVGADQAGRTRRGFMSTAGAVAAARAGGSGAPYEGTEQNKKLCDILRQQIYRGVVGAIRYLPGVQAAASYPATTKDPSLGTPAHMVQCQHWREEVALVGPEPYATAEWMTPPWLA
jgi:branched-chain amino acid transport system substrate-binding protein